MEHPFLRVAVIAVGTGAATLGYNLPDLLPEQDFLQLRELSYEDGSVTFDRAIVPPSVWADWAVVVYPDRGTQRVCSGEGVARYAPDEPLRHLWPLDFFVGDPGCTARLRPGTYTAFATWTPLDGRRVVNAQLRFEVADAGPSARVD